MSGWWFAASAASATALTSAIAARKPLTFTLRRIVSPSRSQPSRAARRSAISASVNGGAYGIRSACVVADEGQELAAGTSVATERSEHRRCDHRRLLFLHAAHHRAEVRAFDNAANALRRQAVHQIVGDLHRHPLLDLEPMRIHVNDARD